MFICFRAAISKTQIDNPAGTHTPCKQGALFILNIKGMATKIVLSDLKERLILSTKYSVTDVSYQA